jgi:hypothetical protein
VSIDEMERFCAEAYPLLVGALSHECHDVHLAEEFAQDALLRACQRWEAVSQLDAPTGWCLRVGLNLSRSWYRRQVVARRARSHLAPAASLAMKAPEPESFRHAVRQAASNHLHEIDAIGDGDNEGGVRGIREVVHAPGPEFQTAGSAAGVLPQRRNVPVVALRTS